MALYDVFKCNVCNKQTEKLVNQTHATLDKCNITFKCVGKLIKIGESDVKNIIDSTEVDWRQRGQSTLAAAIQITQYVPIITGAGVLTLAIAEAQYLGAGPVTAKFIQKKIQSSAFVEYLYNRTINTTQIYGPDDSSKKLSLRFSTTDIVKVFVNGVEFPSSDFDRTVPGRIIFNDVLSATSNIIRIVVSAQETLIVKNLSFTLNESFPDNTTAWTNVSNVSINNEPYRLFTCNDIGDLVVSTTLVLDSLIGSGTVTNTHPPFFVLAQYPYSSYDRNLGVVINVFDAITNTTNINYVNQTLSNNLLINSEDDSIISIFPLISITEKNKVDLGNSLKNDTNTVIKNKYIT